MTHGTWLHDSHKPCVKWREKVKTKREFEGMAMCHNLRGKKSKFGYDKGREQMGRRQVAREGESSFPTWIKWTKNPVKRGRE